MLPVATLILVSFAQEGSWTTQTLPAAYTFANYQRIFSDPYAAEVFLQQPYDVGDCGVAALLWSFCVVTLLRRRRKATSKFVGEGWRRLLSLLVLIPWALPGTVVAVSVAEAYGGPSWLLGSFVLVGTFWILPVVLLSALHAARRARAPGQHGATGSDTRGSGGLARRARVAEIYARDLAARVAGRGRGTLLAFVIALGEYVASVLVFVPANRPISIAIASELRDFNLGAAAAYGVVLIVIISISMIVAGRWNACGVNWR